MMLKHKLGVFLSLTFFLIAAQTSAQEEARKSIPMLLDKAHSSLLGLKLEMSTGDDIQKRLGNTTPVLLEFDGRKDEAHGPYVYCYHASSDSRIYVSFRTGGHENPTAFRYDLESAEPGRNGCQSSASFGKKVQTGGGVKLGMSKESFLRLFPGTPEDRDKTLSYRYEKFVKYDVPKQTEWNKEVKYTGEWQYSEVDGYFQDGKLTRLSVYFGGEMDWE